MLPKAPYGAGARAAFGAIPFTAVVAVTSWLLAEPAARPSQPASPAQSRAAKVSSSVPERAPRFSIAVVSDLNDSYGSTRYGKSVHGAVAALTERFRPSLVLITGDMVAGQKHGVDAPAMWRGFHAAVTEPLERAGIAIAPTPGNHDASPTFTEERAEYARQWQCRSSRLQFVDASNYPLRYSFTFEGAFFVSLDAAAVGPVSADQRSWVEQQLEAAAAYSPKIAFGHLPLYPIAHGREREILSDRALESLFVKHGVNVYFSGHQHAYYPGASEGMRHVSMPCLGAGARALLGTAHASTQALVLVDVDRGELASIEAFRAPDFQAKIERSALPARLALGRYLLTRDDLASAGVPALSASLSTR